MLSKPLRLLIFFFASYLLLGYSDGLLAQRYGTERFKQKYEINSDKVLQVNIDIDAAEVRISKSSQSKEIKLSIYFTEDEFKIYEDYDRKRSLWSGTLVWQKDVLLDEHTGLEKKNPKKAPAKPVAAANPGCHYSDILMLSMVFAIIGGLHFSVMN